jgi:chromosome segregation ATPase
MAITLQEISIICGLVALILGALVVYIRSEIQERKTANEALEGRFDEEQKRVNALLEAQDEAALSRMTSCAKNCVALHPTRDDLQNSIEKNRAELLHAIAVVSQQAAGSAESTHREFEALRRDTNAISADIQKLSVKMDMLLSGRVMIPKPDQS